MGEGAAIKKRGVSARMLSTKIRTGEDDEFYLFFRQRCLALQARFAELVDLKKVPRVFLHGNPHLDNFAKTQHGEGMIDFDRSRVGPYSWDLVRLMCSVSLKREEADRPFLSKKVVKHLMESYLAAFDRPHELHDVPQLLKQEKPKEWEKSTAAYLAHDKRWAKKMRAHPLFPSHPTVQALTELYFQGRGEFDWDSRWQIEEAGQASGSLGKSRVIVALVSKKDPSDKILLDIKEVYEDPDTDFFFNPYVHHGLRMIEASFLHAPGLEQRLGHVTWRGKQYWGRQIPSFKAKLKGFLDERTQVDFVESVGFQLGRAHRLSLRSAEPRLLERNLKEQVQTWINVGERLNDELRRAWDYSCATALIAQAPQSSTAVPRIDVPTIQAPAGVALPELRVIRPLV
jgi:hypothetical protein